MEEGGDIFIKDPNERKRERKRETFMGKETKRQRESFGIEQKYQREIER